MECYSAGGWSGMGGPNVIIKCLIPLSDDYMVLLYHSAFLSMKTQGFFTWFLLQSNQTFYFMDQNVLESEANPFKR